MVYLFTLLLASTQPYYCDELRLILDENVEAGYINQAEADDIHDRCLASAEL